MTRMSEQIKKAIVEQLYSDSRVDASAVTVHVSDGGVTLSGTVPSELAKQAAIHDAYAILGVGRVEDRIAVRPSTSGGPAAEASLVTDRQRGGSEPTDDEIRSDAANRLDRNPGIDTSKLRVGVDGGVVSLTGAVGTLWQKVYAEQLSAGVKGVLRVDNQLQVVPVEPVADDKIAREILASLGRSESVDPKSVEVKVESGVVDLSGTVPDESAQRVVYNFAFHTSGVKEVIENLNVPESS